MSCRFSLEHKNKPYPRTCPTCGIAGSCQQGFRQVAIKEWKDKTDKPKYVILDGNGRPPQGWADQHYSNGIPASILIAQGKNPDEVAHVEFATVHPPKIYDYKPHNCNVAMRKNGVIPPLTCAVCTKSNGGTTGSSAEHARGCLHFHHVTGFGFVVGQAEPAAERWVHPGDPGHGNALGVGIERKRDPEPDVPADSVKQPEPEHVPDNVYYHDGNFYEMHTSRGMGNDFWRVWCHRKLEFPPKPEPEYAVALRDPPKRLSRVVVARVSDIVEEINNEPVPLSEQSIRAYVDKIWVVLDIK